MRRNHSPRTPVIMFNRLQVSIGRDSTNLYFASHTTIYYKTTSVQRTHLVINSGVLGQHHQALWQNCGIGVQHEGQTLWQNKNARLPHLQDFVFLTL